MVLRVHADNARVAQLVEYNLAKVGVAGSSPVSRSFLFSPVDFYWAFLFLCEVFVLCQQYGRNNIIPVLSCPIWSDFPGNCNVKSVRLGNGSQWKQDFAP